MWLERLIIKKAERKLLPYREGTKKLDAALKNQYEKYLPLLTECYKQASHWHGTGRYHYQHQNGSRYEAVETTKVLDILASILQSDGLTPHHDPWIDSGGETVSLATTRMHARAFARIHATGKDTLVYELGSIKFWLRFYFILLFIWLFTNLWSHRPFIRDTLRKTFSRDIQNWASAIRKPTNGKVIGILDMFKGDIPTSDIQNNYPLLLGVKADSNKLIETIPLTHKVEQRSLERITLAMCTHIEVPLQNVLETEQLLKEYGIQLAVIPLEFGDLYLVNTPLKILAFS